jgi:nuclear RNA export factor
MDGGLGGSRNLTRIGASSGTAVKSFHIGAEQAVKALADLPGTKHDIGGPPEKFCIDAFPVVHGQGMGLLLTVHGQFTEGTSFLTTFRCYLTLTLFILLSAFGQSVRKGSDHLTGPSC